MPKRISAPWLVLNRAFRRVLPRNGYLALARWGCALVSPERMPVSAIRWDRSRNLYVVEHGGERLYFPRVKRLERFLWPDAIHACRHRIFRKYLPPDIPLRRDDRVLDAGANIGEFTLAVAERVHHVFSIEPDPHAYECLRLNTEHKTNVTIFNTLLSDENREKEFFIATDRADSSLIRPKRYSKTVTMPAKTLDTLLAEAGIERVDIVKLDAEGAEPEVLKGAANLLRRVRLASIDCGAERSGLSTRDDVRPLLEDAGLRVCEYGTQLVGTRNGFSRAC